MPRSQSELGVLAAGDRLLNLVDVVHLSPRFREQRKVRDDAAEDVPFFRMDVGLHEQKADRYRATTFAHRLPEGCPARAVARVIVHGVVEAGGDVVPLWLGYFFMPSQFDDR